MAKILPPDQPTSSKISNEDAGRFVPVVDPPRQMKNSLPGSVKIKPLPGLPPRGLRSQGSAFKDTLPDDPSPRQLPPKDLPLREPSTDIRPGRSLPPKDLPPKDLPALNPLPRVPLPDEHTLRSLASRDPATGIRPSRSLPPRDSSPDDRPPRGPPPKDIPHVSSLMARNAIPGARLSEDSLARDNPPKNVPKVERPQQLRPKATVRGRINAFPIPFVQQKPRDRSLEDNKGPQKPEPALRESNGSNFETSSYESSSVSSVSGYSTAASSTSSKTDSSPSASRHATSSSLSKVNLSPSLSKALPPLQDIGLQRTKTSRDVRAEQFPRIEKREAEKSKPVGSEHGRKQLTSLALPEANLASPRKPYLENLETDLPRSPLTPFDVDDYYLHGPFTPPVISESAEPFDEVSPLSPRATIFNSAATRPYAPEKPITAYNFGYPVVAAPISTIVATEDEIPDTRQEQTRPQPARSISATTSVSQYSTYSRLSDPPRIPVFPTNYALTSTIIAPRLTENHLSCYQSHRTMKASRNVHAPVPCMVCLGNDDALMSRCTWCYVRLCGGCMEKLDKIEGRNLKILANGMHGTVSGKRESEVWEDDEVVVVR